MTLVKGELKTDRNLVYALSELGRMTSVLGGPKDVYETAEVIYRKAVDKKLTRRSTIEGLASAAAYAAYRKLCIPRTLDEVAEVSRVSKKEIGKTFRVLSKEVGLKLPPTSPRDYVPRFCSRLNSEAEVHTKAIEILRFVEEKGLKSSSDPVCLAGGAIYTSGILCGDRRTQKEVADATKRSEVKIREVYIELAEILLSHHLIDVIV